MSVAAVAIEEFCTKLGVIPLDFQISVSTGYLIEKYSFILVLAYSWKFDNIRSHVLP